MARFSKRHYAMVSPRPDTARDIRARAKTNQLVDKLMDEIREKFDDIDSDNAADVLAYQRRRMSEINNSIYAEFYEGAKR